MKKILILAALMCGTMAYAQTTTTYTGTIKDLTGAVVTSGRITFTLNAPSGGVIPGTGSFTATTVSCLINSSGSPVSSSDGVSPCVITNNASLTPMGTSYTVCRQPYNVTPGSCFVMYANGGTVDLSTLVPTPATQPNYGVASTNLPNNWNQPQTFSGGIAGPLSISGATTTATFNTIVTVQPGTGTISAALAANSGGNTEFKLGCGLYLDNISITSAANWIHGGGRFCTVLQPNAGTAPLINIHPTTAGQGLWYNSVSDLEMYNGGAYAVDGLQLNNLTSSSPHNDYNHFWNLYISGFQNNVSILGGNLANIFENVWTTGAIANNWNVNTTQPVNSLMLHNVAAFSAGSYGMYLNTTSATAWDFQSLDVENNGANILTSNCAGLYMTSGSGEIRDVSIYGSSYFEDNCSGGDANAADIRITGGQTLNVNVQGGFFSFGSGSNSGCAVFADATIGSAVITKNIALKPSSTCGYDYKISNSDTSTGYSGYMIGSNTYVNDGNGEYSFSGSGPMTYVGQALSGTSYFPQGLSLAPNHFSVLNGELMSDDSAGGYNFGTNTSPTYCYRFWRGPAGGTRLAQIDCSGNGIFGGAIEANDFSPTQSVTFTALSAAGTGATTPACVSGFTCTVNSGILKFTSGTASLTTGDIVKMTWSTASPQLKACVMNGFDNTAQTALGTFIQDGSGPSTTQVQFFTTVALTASHQISIYYNCL